MRKTRQRLLPTLMAAPVGGAIAALLMMSNSAPVEMQHPGTPQAATPTCDYTIRRVQGFRYVRPLLSAEPACESSEFGGMKHRLDSVVAAFRAKGTLTHASVYLRDLKSGAWMSYNDTAHYYPGSMLKLPVMMAWLRMAEAQPGLLHRKYVFKGKEEGWPTPEFPPAREVQVGEAYTVLDLMQRMIVESDNLATSVLTRNIEPSTFEGLFSELGFIRPQPGQPAYPMTAREYASFWKALYNGGLLPPADSEFALDMLSRSLFDQGFRKGIGTDVPMASKFGEAGSEGAKQLHESGIVYVKDRPYLITVMTVGPRMHELPPVLVELSRIVHHHMSV